MTTKVTLTVNRRMDHKAKTPKLGKAKGVRLGTVTRKVKADSVVTNLKNKRNPTDKLKQEYLDQQ